MNTAEMKLGLIEEEVHTDLEKVLVLGMMVTKKSGKLTFAVGRVPLEAKKTRSEWTETMMSVKISDIGEAGHRLLTNQNGNRLGISWKGQ